MMYKKYLLLEEIFNSITHGIGFLLAIAGLVVLLLISIPRHDPRMLVGFTIFGGSLILMYLMSTLFHSLIFTKAKKVFKALDQAAIFLFIAGSYTPFALLMFKGWLEWTVLSVIWFIAISGVVFKSIFIDEFEIVSVIIYLCMGWIGVIFIHPLFITVNLQIAEFVIGGGLLFSIGTVFLFWKKLPFSHTFWHLFVLGGTACHFFAISRL